MDCARGVQSASGSNETKKQRTMNHAGNNKDDNAGSSEEKELTEEPRQELDSLRKPYIFGAAWRRQHFFDDVT
eukprot:3603077-Rhodomonas_salina.1